MAVQPDGRIVVAGATANDGDFAVARYLADGTLDPSFGRGGLVTTDVDDGADTAHAVLVQPDGAIVVAGTAQLGDGGINAFALVRYLPDGDRDASFGEDGVVVTTFGPFDEAWALVREPDGRLVAAGSSFTGEAFEFALARYAADGSLDATFGDGGKVTTTVGSARTVARQSDGRYVVAGDGIVDGTPAFVIARYTTDGALDPGFGNGGVAATAGGRAVALAIQPDGNLLVAGTTITDAFAVARYDVAATRFCADPNRDGAITVTDGVLVLRAAAALETGCSMAICDLDGSGAITVTDGVNSLRAAAALSAALTCAMPVTDLVRSVTTAEGTLAVLAVDDAPVPTTDAPATIVNLAGNTTADTGGSNSVTVFYDLDAATADATDDTTLLIAARIGTAAPLAGFFELPLSAAEGEATVTVQFPAAFAAEQFELLFATRHHGIVSRFAALAQRTRVGGTPTRTPTPLPTPTLLATGSPDPSEPDVHDPHPHRDTLEDGDDDADPHPHHHPHAHTHAVADRDAHGDPHRDPHQDRDQNADALADPDSNRDANPDPHARRRPRPPP